MVKEYHQLEPPPVGGKAYSISTKGESVALQIKPTSKWFYGRIMVNGVKKSVNLGIEVKGRRPRSLREKGDALFERSRGQAEEKLSRMQAESKKKKASVEILQTIHEARTGQRATSIPLRAHGDAKGMFEAWQAVPRKRRQSPSYVAQMKSLFSRFIAFIESEYPDRQAREMSDVRSHMARAFMQAEEKRGVSAKTYNNALIALRSAFGLLAKEAALFENPFEGIPTREEDTAFRKPFDIDELSRIVEVANRTEHAFIRPIIITGISTAMRRGDCCLLAPPSVDFGQKFIKVKVGKTHKIAEIPLFPLLEEELKRFPLTKKREYFFPAQAKMYQENPDGITWRVKKVLQDAGYYDAASKKPDQASPAHVADVHAKRETGLRTASIRDFHSFRVSWVTLALTSGVDLELVRMVTGHKTVDIVLKHYFQPGREYFRNNLQSKMPGLLMNRVDSQAPSDSDQQQTLLNLMELTSQLNATNAEQIKPQLMNGLKHLLENVATDSSNRWAKFLVQT